MLDSSFIPYKEDCIVQLKNDLISRGPLDRTIYSYYKKFGNRCASNFLHTEEKNGDAFDTYFLVDRKHVVRYGINLDCNWWTGALSLGIGPHYFGPADFWSYENFQRFSIDATTEAVELNLSLLDEFLGCKGGG
ncbi:hypothetical protein [Variovorax saccharolyticus]|uniref:hypothetical protein n=1 Tax=Variovorax saccharolyticus TaxID=3053516 RepID=UPI0025785CD7|nr:hypothetical protein [Variovorax sp. J31P216]MDM0030444.1 hypothetical protein [Variovorax sp. J31P216]